MADVTWIGGDIQAYWNNDDGWSTGVIPGAGDDVTIPSQGLLLYDGDDFITTVESLTVAGAFGIDVGQFTITGGVTVTGGFEIADPGILDQDAGGPATVTIGGLLTNSGTFGTGNHATVTMASLTNEVGAGGDLGGQVTMTNLDNLGGNVAANTFGAGVVSRDKGGDLHITGTFTNSGSFIVGHSGATLTQTVTTAALDNTATGRLGIHSASVTVGTLDNTGVDASDDGIFIDIGTGDDSLLHVTGIFTNAGALDVGATGTGTKLTINKLDNQASGSILINGASVTVTNLTNAGANTADTPTAGMGVDYPPTSSDESGKDTGGSLTVTDDFINTGDFGVGEILTSKAPSATTVTVATLDNQSTGGINILAGTVTVVTLTNEGAPSTNVPHAGIGIDQLPAQPGGGNLTVTGVFTNTGDFVMGNSGMTGTAAANVSTLVNAGGTIILTAGTAASEVELEIGTTPTPWKGEAVLAGGTSGIAGTALIEMKDNGEIATIGVGGIIKLIGAKAFVADANNASASSALAGLTTINGNLDLDQGAQVAVSGNLTNNGVSSAKGGIAVDGDDSSFGSTLTVAKELVNTGSIGLGNIEAGAVDDEEALIVGSFDDTATGGVSITNTAMEVKGALFNNGAAAGKGIGLDTASGASGGALTVAGTLTNQGGIGAGNAKDDGTTTVTLGALTNGASGTIGVDNAALEVTGALSNIGGGAGKGIGIDLAAGSGEGDLTVGGQLVNSGDIGIGNTTDAGATTASFTGINNTATGSITIIHASVTDSVNMTNAGVGTTSGIDNGLGVDFVDGASGADFIIKGTLTNSGDAGFGNAADDGSTAVSIGLVNNLAAGSIEIMNAGVTVTGSVTSAGVGTGKGIYVGAQDGSTASILTVEGAVTNSGDMEVGDDSADGGQALVTAKNFTNTGLVDIASSSTSSVPTVAVAATYTQAAGSIGLTNVDGTLSAFAISLTGGTIDGSGLIVGPVKNTGGNLQAGPNLTTPGILSIGGASPGSYTQGANGKLSELLAGTATGKFGEVKVNGAVNLAGVLAVELVNGFALAAGQSFDLMNFTANKLTGTFSAIDFGSQVGNAHDVLTGLGLAIVADYENAKGQINLDVVATKVSVATFQSEEPILNQIVTGFAISDTAANIAAALPKLATDASHINTIASTAGVVTTFAANFKADEPALDKVTGGFDVTGTGAGVAANFDALEGDVAHIDKVTLGGASPVLTLTQTQATTDAALSKLVSAPYVLDVTNGSTTTTTGHGNNLTIDAVAGGGQTITGGGTSETFVFSPSFGKDAITDFSSHDSGSGHDMISLPSTDFTSFSAMFAASANVGANVVITAGNGDTLTLDNLTKAALNGLGGDFNLPP